MSNIESKLTESKRNSTIDWEEEWTNLKSVSPSLTVYNLERKLTKSKKTTEEGWDLEPKPTEEKSVAAEASYSFPLLDLLKLCLLNYSRANLAVEELQTKMRRMRKLRRISRVFTEFISVDTHICVSTIQMDNRVMKLFVTST